MEFKEIVDQEAVNIVREILKIEVLFRVLDMSLYIWIYKRRLSVKFSSVAQLCPTLCNPVNCSTPKEAVMLIISKTNSRTCPDFIFHENALENFYFETEGKNVDIEKDYGRRKD